jgi:hypothetical protein
MCGRDRRDTENVPGQHTMYGGHCIQMVVYAQHSRCQGGRHIEAALFFRVLHARLAEPSRTVSIADAESQSGGLVARAFAMTPACLQRHCISPSRILSVGEAARRGEVGVEGGVLHFPHVGGEEGNGNLELGRKEEEDATEWNHRAVERSTFSRSLNGRRPPPWMH